MVCGGIERAVDEVIPALTCGRELCIVIERKSSWIRAAEMSFSEGCLGSSLETE